MPLTILLAEDDRASREFLRHLLEKEAGDRVIQTGDGREAWALLRDHRLHFDLAVVDIMLPEVSGLELVENIRGTPSLKAMPIILCTALRDMPTVQKAAALGVRHYVAKPPSQEIVSTKLRQVRAEIAAKSTGSKIKSMDVPPEQANPA